MQPDKKQKLLSIRLHICIVISQCCSILFLTPFITVFQYFVFHQLTELRAGRTAFCALFLIFVFTRMIFQFQCLV